MSGFNPKKGVIVKALNIINLHVSVNGTKILKGVNLEVEEGQVHVIMGKNGSGKSTLAAAIAGNPVYEVDEGSIDFYGENLLEFEVFERARKGIFLSFQNPEEIPGLEIEHFLKMAKENITGTKIPAFKFHKELLEVMREFGIPESYAERSLNEGFSGGEKKKSEILQMAVLKPKFVILDETDSGLDVDAIKVVFEKIAKILAENSGMSVLIITHYKKVLDYLKPDRVHIMKDGKIIKSGDISLAEEIEVEGYAKVFDEYEREE